ncbi:MAG: IclR family transcriptional regulator [Beutenbergiaceae bacterium]
MSRSVDRALEALVRVARADGPLRFTELLDLTGVPRGTLHDLLASLESAGFLERNSHGAYQVGATAFEVGMHMPLSSSLHEDLHPELETLAATTGEACHLGTLVDSDVIYLDRCDQGVGLRWRSKPGQRLPAYSTGVGKAMLATLTDREVRDLLPDHLVRPTPATVKDADELLRELAQIRERGYSLESEESTPGVCCIGIGTKTAGRPLAVSIAVPTQRSAAPDLVRFLPSLRNCLDRIEVLVRAHERSGTQRTEPRESAS